jgi:hypothetical protein
VADQLSDMPCRASATAPADHTTALQCGVITTSPVWRDTASLQLKHHFSAAANSAGACFSISSLSIQASL